MISIKYLAILVSILILETDTYRILGIFPMAFKSHNIYFQALMKGLAKRGHQVDIISYHELARPLKNYRTIMNLANLSSVQTRGRFDSSQKVVTLQETIESSRDFLGLAENIFGVDICDLMSHEKIQEFIKNPPKDPAYDLVITEGSQLSCYLGFGPLFNVPVISAVANFEFAGISENIGNPVSSSFFPYLFYGKFEVKTFWDRLRNVWGTRHDIYRFKYLTENQSGSMRKHMSPDIPTVREVEKMVALSIVNIHHSLHGPRPKTPALIEVGGLHIEEDESDFTQSEELERWMNGSIDGVVYVSLGTVVPIEYLPNKTIKAMFSSFAKLAPMRVLIKSTKGCNFPHKLPENAITMTWIPQIPVLRHNNTRLFITHGGLHSIMEATYFGMPMIGVPLFWDQYPNVEMVVKKNMAIQLDFENLTEKTMDEALTKILKDARYREAAKNLSTVFRDRPMRSIDTATYWIEYIARNGAQSLRSPAIDLYWWQNQLLDVYGFLLFCSVSIIYILIIIGKTFFKKCLMGKTKSKLKSG